MKSNSIFIITWRDVWRSIISLIFFPETPTFFKLEFPNFLMKSEMEAMRINIKGNLNWFCMLKLKKGNKINRGDGIWIEDRHINDLFPHPVRPSVLRPARHTWNIFLIFLTVLNSLSLKWLYVSGHADRKRHLLGHGHLLHHRRCVRQVLQAVKCD